MSNKLKNKKTLTTYQNEKSAGAVHFIIEKDGKAYFKDKKLAIICKKSKIVSNPKYPNYFWEYDYMQNLQWFKKIVALMLVNNGNMRFVGMTADEFNELGGVPISISDAQVIDSKKIQKLMK